MEPKFKTKQEIADSKIHYEDRKYRCHYCEARFKVKK